MREKLVTVLAAGLMLTSGLSSANAYTLTGKNGFFPIEWKIQASARPDFVRVTNNSSKTQNLFIYIAADSAPVEVYNCHQQDKNDLFANSSITCRVPNGESVQWYIASTLDDTNIGFIHGTYQLEMNRGE